MALTGQSGQFSSLLEGPRMPVHFAIKSGKAEGLVVEVVDLPEA